MISRCPGCGAQVKEEENKCPSCGWDFTARQNAPKSVAPQEPAFSLPTAKSIGPAIKEPAGFGPPAQGPADFQLPQARPRKDEPPAAPLPAAPSPEKSQEPPGKPPISPAEKTPPGPKGVFSGISNLFSGSRRREEPPAPAPERPANAVQSPPEPGPPPAAPLKTPAPLEPKTPAPLEPKTPAPLAAPKASAPAEAPELSPAPIPPPASEPVPAAAPAVTDPPNAAAQSPAPEASAPEAGFSDLASAAPADAATAAPRPASSPATALLAAAVLAVVSLGVGYRLLSHPPPAPPPPPPAPPAPPVEYHAPATTPVSFGEAKVVVATEELPPAAAAPAPVRAAPVPRAQPRRPSWKFSGMAFDLMTGEPVYAAKIILQDAHGQDVGSAETNADGLYSLAVPADAAGYQLKIKRTDYLERCVDQGPGTRALRQATPDERLVLIHAVNSRPWIGAAGRETVHDLALIPVNAGQPQ